MKIFKYCFLFIFLFIIPIKGNTQENMITKDEIVQVQNEWGDGVVAIGKTFLKKGDYQRKAKEFIKKFYAYNLGTVLFKPTKTKVHQFRSTKEGALSYFVNKNKEYPEDKGFALEPWTSVRFEDQAFYIKNKFAIVMGNYYFTPQKGKDIKVEFTFGYIKDDMGKLKIILHHSSLPYK